MYLREGDYVETVEHLIFAVKGLSHPKDRTIAYLRYIPDPRGERMRRDGLRFRRIYDLRESTEYLKTNFAKYLHFDETRQMLLQAIPDTVVLIVYRPEEGLAEMRRNPVNVLEEAAVRFAEAIAKEAGIALRSIGVSGSLLLGLATDSSDIDLAVYGEQNCRQTYEALKRMRIERLISAYDTSQAMKVTKERWSETGLDLSRLAEIEKAKLLHGLFERRGYFIRLVKGCAEKEATYTPLGSAVIRARIRDDRDSIFTPCSYLVDCLEWPVQGRVEELVSFRGKFTEQAHTGELIKAQGKLEKIEEEKSSHLRLLLGDPDDYMIPIG
jgi:hypothetical protein